MVDSGKPLVLTDTNFEEAEKNHPSLIVDCWAPWCGPCIMIAPVIDELAKNYFGKITFGKVNVDENPRISQRFGIMSIPTLLFIKNRKLVDRMVGVAPKGMIEDKIKRIYLT
ncbi:thioredoxin [Candidatus Bathyarchaeota archaeon]|nr:thioredoxin [Candidatus Bathyarchaeota archaeon]